jgi:hypothetical protein
VLELGAAAVQRERLRFGRRHLGADADHVQLGDVAGPVAPLGQVERVAVGRDGLAHQRALFVGRAQGQIGPCHVGLHQQARALQQRLARLRIERGGLAGPGEPAEQVDLVAQVRSGAEPRGRGAPGLRLGAAGGAGADADLRCTIGIGRTQDGAGLLQPCAGDLDRVVGAPGALDQRIQRRVREGLPPLAARLRLGRRGQRPEVIALEAGRRHRQGGGIDGGCRDAAGEEEGGEKGSEERAQAGAGRPLGSVGGKCGFHGVCL